MRLLNTDLLWPPATGLTNILIVGLMVAIFAAAVTMITGEGA